MTAPALRGSYPHPVLDESDDVASKFDVTNFRFEPGIEDIGLRFEVRSTDPTLKQLMQDGNARLSLRWRCSATMATQEGEPTVTGALSDGNRYEFWLDHKQVRGAVTADVRVIAEKPLTAFRWERQHAEYGGAVFDLGVGDVLADGGSFTFEAEKLFDPLDPPIGSCFEFVEDHQVRRGIKVTFDDQEVIRVRMSPVMHQNLALLASRPELQITSVVLPALIQAVTLIKDELRAPSEEDWTEFAWFRAISNLALELGGFEDDAIVIAQKILDYPVDLTLTLESDPAEDDE